MHAMFYSAGTGGFFHKAVHGEAIPDDAVRITAARHAELIAAQARGHTIAAGPDGRPRAIAPPAPDLSQLRAQAAQAVNSEVAKRIHAFASPVDQGNDACAMAAHALRLALDPALPMPAEVAAALDRRERIEAIRAAGRTLRARISAMPASNLATFDAATHRAWPEQRP